MPDNADHVIPIRLINNQHAIPSIPTAMHVGQQVRYFSPDGEVRLIFPNGSPFNDAKGNMLDEIRGSAILTLENPGVFFCRCFITPPDQAEVGWDPVNSPESGGEHDVGH